jgi:proteasome lid subunit RPN8/RPN11
LSLEQLGQVYAAAVRAYPAEACGFVRARGVRACVNAVEQLRGDGPGRTTQTGYAFAGSDLLELYRSLDGDDPVLVVYHSHPDVGAYFSAEDHRHAVIDGEPAYPVDHLVVDVTRDGVRGARQFSFSRALGRYVATVTYGEPMPAGVDDG